MMMILLLYYKETEDKDKIIINLKTILKYTFSKN